MNPFYTDYQEYAQRVFPGLKVQKISLNAGLSCPNRDGTISHGGCIYCLNESFTPSYCLTADSIPVQLQKGIAFFSHKYPAMKYLAYFQSFTNTHAPLSTLRDIYMEALAPKEVAGLVIGTRPDCLQPETIALLADLGRRKPLFVELGAETSHNATLRTINRGHTWECVEQTVRHLTDAGICHVGLHLICGLPGETETEILQTVERATDLPVESLKFHHLQVLRGTPLASMLDEGRLKVPVFNLGQYLDLCMKIVKRIPRRICIERFLASSPPGLVVSPKWGIKNFEFTHLLHNRLKAESVI